MQMEKEFKKIIPATIPSSLKFKHTWFKKKIMKVSGINEDLLGRCEEKNTRTKMIYMEH